MRVPDVCEGHGCAEPVESLNVECWEITGRVLCDSCAAEEFDRRAEYWADEPDESQAALGTDKEAPRSGT